jgi:Protein of unknown function (DUF2500)
MEYYYGGVENSMFTIMPVIIIIIFIVVLGIFIVNAVQGARQWKENNDSPILSVEATVVTKRSQVHHSNGSDNTMSSSFTNYYVTFQVESKDRLEFRINGSEYGMLAEQDFGKLLFQGTRYLGFERTKE